MQNGKIQRATPRAGVVPVMETDIEFSGLDRPRNDSASAHQHDRF